MVGGKGSWQFYQISDQLVGEGNDREDTERIINEELTKLHTWFCKNKLTLHPDKS